jgi:methionyl-tRNA formyltransferase
MTRPRVVFMGTPAFAVPALRAVAAATDVALVVTQPDRPKGRGRVTGESEVAAEAQSLGIEDVFKVEDMSAPPAIERLRAARADLFAVVAFGAILTPEALKVPRLGSINLHGSLLPEYRGASPVQRALWDGCAGTGVTTLWMDEGIDTGDVILQRWEPILPDDDAGTLAARLAGIGAPLLAESLVRAADGEAPRIAQDRMSGSYARKLRKEDGVVTWDAPASQVWNRQRAVTPWPGAVTWHQGRQLLLTRTRPEHELKNSVPPGTVIDVSRDGVHVVCGPGVLKVERVKPEGRNEMSAADWARGARVSAGERLMAGKEAEV